MKITIFQQQDKKISVNFIHKGIVDKFVIDKAEEFLVCVDRFIKKRKIDLVSLRKASLRFENTGLLTERVIRSIILGLRF